MSIKVSNLRKDIYRLLDQVLATGQPLEVERKGMILKIVPGTESTGKLSRLRNHDCIVGDPDELVHSDWSHEWNGVDV